MPAAVLTPAVFLLAAVLSALLTLLWIGIARRRALLDHPGARRLHARATPRGGGIGIAILAAAAWLWAWYVSPADFVLLHAGLGVALFALVGLVDDLSPLPALPKLSGQLLAALVLCSGGAQSPWVVAVVLVLACAYWVNIVNFMDGSNGLVGLQGLLLALVLAAWPGQDPGLVLPAIVLAGACAGFLPFNLGHAKTFLGDIGSHAVGAALFALFLATWRAGTLPLVSALTMATPLLLDSGLTLAGRIRSGRTPWKAHREHLYQYAVRCGVPHTRVALAYAGWTLASSLLSTIGINLRSSSVMWALFMLNAVLGTAAYCGLRRHWLSARKQGRSVG